MTLKEIMREGVGGQIVVFKKAEGVELQLMTRSREWVVEGEGK